jgi:ribonuclease P/MRP protein subunit RPP40
MELIVPEELYEIIKSDFLTKVEAPVYSRVTLPLQALLEGDFFNEFIKRGKKVSVSGLLFNMIVTDEYGR